MSSFWSPIHENHAIDAMAAFVRFTDPLTELLLKRVIRSVEQVATELELKTVLAGSAIAFAIGPDGVTPAASPGRRFVRMTDGEDGAEASKQPIEELRVEHQRLLYRTTEYVSWEWQFNRIRQLFDPILAILAESVAYEAIGMEYLDRFHATADGTGNELRDLLQIDSGLVAPHIFEAMSLFHSHTGVFIDSDFADVRLQVVKIDGVPRTDQDARKLHWINIVTTQEDRFWRTEEDDRPNPDVFPILDKAHDDLKALLGRVITTEKADRIFLQG